MLERGHARRLLLLWFASTLVLTLAPFTPLRAAPRGFDWIRPSVARLGGFDFVANIALFVPLGVLGVAAGLRRRMAIVLGPLLSFLVESMQSYLVLRYPSYFDLVANAAGAALGALLAQPILVLWARVDRPAVRAAVLLAGGATALWLAANVPEIRKFGLLFPFALSVLASLVGGGLWRPRVALTLSAATTVAVCLPLWGLHPALVLVAATGAMAGVWPSAVVSRQLSVVSCQ